MRIKHSKYKNTGILFELLVRQITSDTLENKNSKVKEILQKYFVKTELGREYKLYETLLRKTSLSEGRANITINDVLESSRNLNRRLIRKQKYNLISELKEHYNLDTFFNAQLPNYKVQAAFYTLLEIYNSDKAINPEYIISNKVTILEHLTAAPIKAEVIRNKVISEFKEEDKDVRILAYRILLEKFNEKYKNFNQGQKDILQQVIYSIDNRSGVHEFYSNKANEITNELTQLNKNVTDEVTQIKVNEIISLIDPKNIIKVTDDKLVNLLQYCSLIEELKIANEATAC